MFTKRENYFAPAIPLTLILLSLNVTADPNFPLNFQIGEPGLAWPGNCGVNGITNGMCTTAGFANDTDPDRTPFYQERKSIDGRTYWHQIIGDPSQGFATEVYIEVESSFFLLSTSGGRPSTFKLPGFENQSGNGWDPLGFDPTNDTNFTGNGTGNPTKVIMRQVMDGEWDDATKTWQCGNAAFCSEFIKSEFANKPTITQQINDPIALFQSTFQVDMSNLTYSDATTPANITSQIIISDPQIPDGGAAGNFNLVSNVNGTTIDVGGRLPQASNVNVSGGRYTYTPGAGWVTIDFVDAWDYQAGIYDYDTDKFDQTAIDWANYFDPAQNPYPSGNKAKCDSGALTGSCP